VDFLQTTKFLEHLLTPAIYRPVGALGCARNITVFGSIGVGKSTCLNALINQVVQKHKCTKPGFFVA
jgi:GTP-binding protein EngB required for normal cell division